MGAEYGKRLRLLAEAVSKRTKCMPDLFKPALGIHHSASPLTSRLRNEGRLPFVATSDKNTRPTPGSSI